MKLILYLRFVNPVDNIYLNIQNLDFDNIDFIISTFIHKRNDPNERFLIRLRNFKLIHHSALLSPFVIFSDYARYSLEVFGGGKWQ